MASPVEAVPEFATEPALFLTLVWKGWMHRALGYRTRDAYARERLGMDPTRARALVRLERALVLNETLARTYRSGSLSWMKTSVLAPLVCVDSLGWFVEDWVAWAGRVTVRRLREDVEQALVLSETDPEAFRRGGGRPPQVCGDREIRAQHRGAEKGVAGDERDIGAAPRDWERHLEGDERGRLSGAMLDHVLSAWGLDGKTAARYEVFARDGWRCAVPGCTSMQNLHSHHIRFRSAEGSDAPENRITLCAFHHLRGVHAGRVRCTGRAPDGLRWEMGIRPGVAPLLSYRSGDLRVPPMVPPSSSPEVSS